MRHPFSFKRSPLVPPPSWSPFCPSILPCSILPFGPCLSVPCPSFHLCVRPQQSGHLSGFCRQDNLGCLHLLPPPSTSCPGPNFSPPRQPARHLPNKKIVLFLEFFHPLQQPIPALSPSPACPSASLHLAHATNRDHMVSALKELIV